MTISVIGVARQVDALATAFPLNTMAGDLAVFFNNYSVQNAAVTSPLGTTVIGVDSQSPLAEWIGYKLVTAGDIAAGFAGTGYACTTVVLRGSASSLSVIGPGNRTGQTLLNTGSTDTFYSEFIGSVQAQGGLLVGNLFAFGNTWQFTSLDGATWTSQGRGIVNNAAPWSSQVWTAPAAGGVPPASHVTGTGGVPAGTANAQGTHLYSVVVYETNSPPYASTNLSPSTGSIDLNSANTFGWTFNDPNAGDTQSKFDLQYRIGAAAWTTVTSVSTTSSNTFAAGTFTAANYEWQVRTYDALGLQGPWSASAFFTAGTIPATPVITAPAAGGTIPGGTGTITWTAPNQASYEVRKVADNAGAPDTTMVYYDSAEVVNATARSAPFTFPVNNRYEHLEIRIRFNGLWSAWADVRINVFYTPPATPLAQVNADNPSASVYVRITDPTPTGGQPAVVSHDIYRRLAGVGAGIRIAAAATGQTYIDLVPAGGVAYEYQVVANSANSTIATTAWTA